MEWEKRSHSQQGTVQRRGERGHSATRQVDLSGASSELTEWDGPPAVTQDHLLYPRRGSTTVPPPA